MMRCCWLKVNGWFKVKELKFKFKQLAKINRLIEIWGNKNSSESKIINFLSQKENEFILTMKFGATDSHAKLTYKWQSEERDLEIITFDGVVVQFYKD